MARAERRRKLNDDMIIFLRGLFLVGTSKDSAYRLIAEEYNLNRMTLYRWQSLGEDYSQIQANGGTLSQQQKRLVEFAELEQNSLARLENKLIYKMIELATLQEQPNFKALQFVLERKFPDLYPRRAPLVVTDKNDDEPEGALWTMLKSSIGGDNPPGYRGLPETLVGDHGEVIGHMPADSPESYARRILGIPEPGELEA